MQALSLLQHGHAAVADKLLSALGCTIRLSSLVLRGPDAVGFSNGKPSSQGAWLDEASAVLKGVLDGAPACVQCAVLSPWQGLGCSLVQWMHGLLFLLESACLHTE